MKVAAAIFLLAVGSSLAATNHVVKGGESVDSIAHRYGVEVEALVKANRLDKPELIQVGQKLVIPSAAGTGTPAKTYTVEEGDTLGAIANNKGTSLQRLMELNKLDSADNLSVGQVLLIPQGDAPAQSASPALALPADLKKALDVIPVRSGRWRYIVIHHSATAQGSARSMDLYHRRKGMENGLAYHFVIGNGRGTRDGVIEIGSRWKRQIKGGHLASERLNEVSIGICLVGNFNNTRPTQAQMRSLRALVQYVMMRSRAPASAVKMHREINTKPTECPGRQFPRSQMLQGL